jgi:hypothetical protein
VGVPQSGTCKQLTYHLAAQIVCNGVLPRCLEAVQLRAPVDLAPVAGENAPARFLPRSGARAMHLVCPHCRNPIEVVETVPTGEVVCPSCGSSFHLEGEPTTLDFPLEAPRKVGSSSCSSSWASAPLAPSTRRAIRSSTAPWPSRCRARATCPATRSATVVARFASLPIGEPVPGCASIEVHSVTQTGG